MKKELHDDIHAILAPQHNGSKRDNSQREKNGKL